MKSTIMWLGFIFLVSVLPHKNVVSLPGGADKVLHFVIYAITCTLFFGALKGPLRSRIKGAAAALWAALALSVVLASGYGMVVEVAQWELRTGVFSWADGAANAAGAITAAALIAVREKFRPATGAAGNERAGGA